MGKKSKRPSKQDADKRQQAQTNGIPTATVAATATETTATTENPTSDGPSQEEIDSLQTSSTGLQTKLNQLANLALSNDRKGFVDRFVPLDLSPSDTAAYLKDLTTAPEAEGQWGHIRAEIVAIAAGRGVDKIGGDQVNDAVFYFQHPTLEGCDREVSFVCTDGEWRADG